MLHRVILLLNMQELHDFPDGVREEGQLLYSAEPQMKGTFS